MSFLEAHNKITDYCVSIWDGFQSSADLKKVACLQAVVCVHARVQSPGNPVAILDELTVEDLGRFVTALVPDLPLNRPIW